MHEQGEIDCPQLSQLDSETSASVGCSARPLPDVFPNGNYQTGDA